MGGYRLAQAEPLVDPFPQARNQCGLARGAGLNLLAQSGMT